MISSAEIEYPECPMCESGQRDVVYKRFTPFGVVRCCSCRFYYLYPRLKESVISDLYIGDDYFNSENGGYSNYKEQEGALRATFQRLMINLKKRKLTGGSLLEVGCGYGFLLEAAKKYFGFRIGTEYSKSAVVQARKKADKVYEGGIEQIPTNEKFDCIILTHVIEHVYHPKDFLLQLSGHLKDGGKMVIATPNMGSFWRYFMGHRWPSFKIPEHILYFDYYSLSVLMQQSGLKNIDTLPYPHAFPLSLIAAKLKIGMRLFGNRFNLWLPATTVAMYGYYQSNKYHDV